MPSNRVSTVTRRGLLVTGVTTAVAGCTRLSEAIVDYYVEDVNLFNTSDERLGGTIEVVGPGDRTLLAESFDLFPNSADAAGEPSAIYGNVLSTSGPHEVTIQIDATGTVDGAVVSRAVTVSDPDEQRVVGFLGEEFTDEFVTIRVVDDFEELETDLERS